MILRYVSLFRLVLPHSEQSIEHFDSMRVAPPGHKSARDLDIREVDGDRIVDDAVKARWRDRPAVRTSILIEPFMDLSEPGSETAIGERQLDPHGETALGFRDHQP